MHDNGHIMSALIQQPNPNTGGEGPHRMSNQASDKFLSILCAIVSSVWSSLQADRKTTIRTYMESHGDIMEEHLPPEIAARYGG